MKTLKGDRDVEWGFCRDLLKMIQPHTVIDVGSGDGTLSRFTAGIATRVFAIDLEHAIKGDRITPLVGDAEIMARGLCVECVLNCSTIEHVGLAGRYSIKKDDDNADIQLMCVLKECLRPNGCMILTLPVGLDAVHRPFHRVYGKERLPLLLEGWTVEYSRWNTKEDNAEGWYQVTKAEALTVESSPTFYAIGCLLLKVQS